MLSPKVEHTYTFSFTTTIYLDIAIPFRHSTKHPPRLLIPYPLNHSSPLGIIVQLNTLSLQPIYHSQDNSMMQRLSSNCNENMVGPCYSCGYFHHGGQANCNSFSMIFSMQNHHHIPAESYEDSDNNMYGFSSSPSVDCTLSLGPPSSRFIHENEKLSRKKDCMTNFCNWDILQTNTSSSSPSSTHKGNRAGCRTTTNNGSDPLLARRCTNCDTTSTPLWRNGPRGPKSLCNACGIRYKKEERRASAAAATNRGGTAAVVETQHIINGASSWMHHSSYGNSNELRFIQHY